MWVYRGHRAIITLTDGSAVRGRIGWSWVSGLLKLREAESLDGDSPTEIPGVLLIPRARILIAQVL